MSMPGNPDEEFDRIVEGLEFDLGDEDLPEDPAEPDEPDGPLEPAESRAPSDLPPELDWFADDGGYDDPTIGYQPATDPIDLGLNLGWAAALGVPILMTLATLSGVILPRPVTVALGLIFVAGVVYLFSRIPRERPDGDGDDGAVV